MGKRQRVVLAIGVTALFIVAVASAVGSAYVSQHRVPYSLAHLILPGVSVLGLITVALATLLRRALSSAQGYAPKRNDGGEG